MTGIPIISTQMPYNKKLIAQYCRQDGKRTGEECSETQNEKEDATDLNEFTFAKPVKHQYKSIAG